MANKIPSAIVAEVVELQTQDPAKSKGKQGKKDGFFWEAYRPTMTGKRGIMTQWDKEVQSSLNWTLEFDKNGKLVGKHPVQNAKKIAADAARIMAAEAKAKRVSKEKK